MFTRIFGYFSAALLSTVIFILAGCGTDGAPTTSGAGSVTAKLAWNGDKTTGKTVASAPAGVVTVQFTISGPAMTSIQQSFAAASGTGVINNVPVGSGLTVTAAGLDGSGALVFQGSVGNLAVQAGQTTNAGTVVLNPAATLKPGTAAKIALTDNTSNTLNFNFPANAVSQTANVIVAPVALSALPAPLSKVVNFAPDSANGYVAAFSINAPGVIFNVPIPVSGSVASTITSGTVLNIAIYQNNTWVDVSTVTVGADGVFIQSLVSTALPGVTAAGTYLVYKPAAGTSTAVSNLGIALIADDGNGIGSSYANGVQVINLFDANGVPLATPTLKYLTYSGAADIDGLALTPDGSQGILVDGGNTVRFFSHVQTGAPIASTTTVNVTDYGGDGDSVAIMPNGDEAVVTADSSFQIVVISGVTSGNPKTAEVIAVPGTRDGLVISNDGKVLLARGYSGLTVYSIAAITPKTGSQGVTISHSFTKTIDIPSLGTGDMELEDGRNGIAISPKDSNRATIIGYSATSAPQITLVTGLTVGTPTVGPPLTIKGAAQVFSVTINPDGLSAVVGTDRGIVLVTGIATGTLSQTGTAPYAPTFVVGGYSVQLAYVPTLGITLDGKYAVVCYSDYYGGTNSGTLLVIPIDTTKTSGFGAVVGQLNGIAVPGNDQMVLH